MFFALRDSIYIHSLNCSTCLGSVLHHNKDDIIFSVVWSQSQNVQTACSAILGGGGGG